MPDNKTNVIIGPSFRLSSPAIPKGRQAAPWAKHLAQCSRPGSAWPHGNDRNEGMTALDEDAAPGRDGRGCDTDDRSATGYSER